MSDPPPRSTGPADLEQQAASGALEQGGADALARRKMLKLAAYTVPAVIGTLATRQAAAGNSCQPWTDCHPNSTCNPCWPKPGG